jgi:hypothetical protein
MEAAAYTMVKEQGHLLHQHHDQLALLGTTMKEVLHVLNRLNTSSEVLHTSDGWPPTMGRQ